MRPWYYPAAMPEIQANASAPVEQSEYVLQ